MVKRIRIIMAKPGLDGHDRGIKILAKAYRDAGMDDSQCSYSRRC